MAVGDITHIPLTVGTLTTATANIYTVPAGYEATIRLVRLVCLLTAGANPTASIGRSGNCNELCANEVIPIPSASVLGSKNATGPDFFTMVGGAVITGRASANDAVRYFVSGTLKQVA